MKQKLRLRRYVLTVAIIATASSLDGQAWAGNEANFVLYDHHTDAKGETEANVFNDFSNAVNDDAHYAAQRSRIDGRRRFILKAIR